MSKLAQRYFIPVFKVTIFLLPFGIFVFLAIQYFAVLGVLSISYDFSKESHSISEWYPKGRALDREYNTRTQEYYQRIVGEPTYIDVDVPRSFDTVDVTIDYKDTDQPIAEFGIVTSEKPFAVRLYPFESTVLDEALEEVKKGNWSAIKNERDQTLLQRGESTFQTPEQFIENVPMNKSVATYQIDLPIQYHQESYEPQEGTLVIDRLLRGQHEFVTYIKNETLYAQFDLIDMNREFNDDIVSIEVYSGRTLIHTAFLSDDGINDARAQASVVRSLIVDIPNLPEGAYSLKVITSSDDVVISRIETFQHLFVAKGKLFLINNVEYQSILPHISTNSSTMYAQNMQFSARTDHPSGLQTIFVDDEELSLETVSQTMYWSPRTTDTSVLHTVTLPKNDVILYSNGYFAFAKEHFFDPDYLVERLSETTTLDALDYILYTNYQQAEEGTRNRTQQIHIDLNQTTVDRKQLTFVLSAPGIDRRSATLMIQRVQFDFHREPLLKRLLQKFK